MQPSRRSLPRLERGTIVRTALELLDEVGLDGLTLRCLAQKLGVQASALYWHFENKQKLIDAMVEMMLTSDEPPQPGAVAEGRWAEGLMLVGLKLRGLLLAHRDGARLLASADMSGAASLQRLDFLLGIMTAAGFSPAAGLRGIFTVINFTLGSVFEMQMDPDGRDEVRVADLAGVLNQQPLPHLLMAYQDLGGVGGALNADVEFEKSLEIIIAGLERMLQ